MLGDIKKEERKEKWEIIKKERVGTYHERRKSTDRY